jgi:5-methylcytosine-specific restriction protein A
MPVMPPTFRARAPHNAPARGGQHRYTARLRRVMRQHRINNPLCLGCTAVGRVAAAEVCDHIVPCGDDDALAYSTSNLQSACKWHHDAVKQQLERSYQQGNATADDLRLDSEAAKRLTRRLMGID